MSLDPPRLRCWSHEPQLSTPPPLIDFSSLSRPVLHRLTGCTLALWLPLTLGLTVGLLQPVKGVIVVLQWRMGMHGFEPMKRDVSREVVGAMMKELLAAYVAAIAHL
jgi:hypothetical protein